MCLKCDRKEGEERAKDFGRTS